MEEKEEQEAIIEKSKSDIEDLDTKIEELSSSIGTNEADLKAATLIREKEASDYAAEEADLTDTIDALTRAKGILEKEMAKIGGGSAALLQEAQGTNAVIAALKTLVEASSISAKDGKRLTAFIQSRDTDTEGEEEDRAMVEGAPDPAAYEGKSGGIISVMEDMLEKAEGQLADARKEEMNAKHNFEMLKQSLTDEINNHKKQMDKAKKGKAKAEETQATADGELAVVNKDLAEDVQYLNDIHHDCMTKATDFEATTQSRDAELEALATAKKIIVEKVAASSASSFLQLKSSTKMSETATSMQVVKKLREVAKATKSIAIAKLVSALETRIQFAVSNGEDPFAKVKGLIQEMIEKLVKEAEEEAAHKAYCDEEMGETKEKKTKLEAEMEKLETRIEKMTADIARLREEVKTLQKELAALANAEKEMDEIRAKEHEEYVVVSAELKEGIEGIQMALKVLRDYYAKAPDDHGKASGAGSGIIGLLEVAESDFSKNLEDVETEEQTAQDEYDKIKKENEITKVTKEQDVKYKTKEYKGLEKTVEEATGDLNGFKDEYAAVMEYWEKIKEECIAKPEPYAERKRRREAEIEGLKEALSILEAEAFVQVKAVTRTLRGVAPHRRSA